MGAKKKAGKTAATGGGHHPLHAERVHELQEGMEKPTLEDDGGLTADQHKKLKKTMKKKKRQLRKKQRTSRKQRSSPGKRILELSIEEDQAKLEMMLMEKDRETIDHKDSYDDRRSGLGHDDQTPSEPKPLRVYDIQDGKASMRKATRDDDEEFKSEYAEDITGAMGYCGFLRPSVFGAINIECHGETAADYVALHPVISSQMHHHPFEYDIISPILKEVYVPPASVFLASLPMVSYLVAILLADSSPMLDDCI